MRGRGCIRDAAHKRSQKSSYHLLGSSPTVPDQASLEQYEAPILDQGQTGSCTGHGTAQGIFTASKAAGRALPWTPSPRGIYDLARAIERVPVNSVLPPLQDNGAMPADCMSGISVWGIRAMRSPTSDGRNSDVEASNVNDEPQLAELEAESTRLITGEYRINEQSPTLITQCCAAIASGYPIVVGGFVDSAFENWSVGLDPIPAPNQNDTSGGGHCICITSYRTHSTGQRVFRGVNSWGASWGDSGHFEVSEAWMHELWDVYPMQVSITATFPGLKVA